MGSRCVLFYTRSGLDVGRGSVHGFLKCTKTDNQVLNCDGIFVRMSVLTSRQKV